MADLIITIDGPAASGKSTVAALLAGRLGASFLDTGAMYRAVTLAAMQAGSDLNDEQQLLGILSSSEFKFAVKEGKTAVLINGVDVTEQLRDPQVTANARYIASAAGVRAELVRMQREFAAGEKKIVTEGRDQGTIAFPDAHIKFYLTADPAERARRRQAELQGENIETVQKDIAARDKSDQSRQTGPLKPADDAIIVDTTDLSIEEVVEKLQMYVEKNAGKNA